ncbi:MAG TPA: O-antigen ligase family protein [Vicinamibacterales bacterium]|nr:O-antigen ligase family protein [Vicinamibacterales bacterium]
MDRISKLLVVLWAVAALLFACYLVSGAWRLGGILGPVLFGTAALCSALDRRAVAPIAAVAYVVPVLVFAEHGRYHATFSVVWLAALLGAVLPQALRHGWHVPPRWRAALVCWVGGVCLTTPIIMLRAVDFRWELLFRGRLPTEALGGLPLLTIGWVLHVALLLAIGLLWFDWLCGQDEAFLVRWVAAPFGCSVVVLALVCYYQMFVDVTFLNESVYAYFRRASGTVLDGNVAGALAAYWIGGWTMFAAATRGRRRLAGVALAALMWPPVWATGSRTALAAALIISVFSLAAFWRGRLLTRRGLAAAAVAAVLLAAGITIVVRSPLAAAGPVQRIARLVPSADRKGLTALLTELWNRNGYGQAATRIIVAYPWFGIGVGSFNEMASEFHGHGITPDNAQNWYRHQLAELGVVGSLGWMAFLASFGPWVLRRHDREQPAARPARGILVAVALVSLLGMAGQDPFVAITLWTFAAWYLFAAGRPLDTQPVAPRTWALAGVVMLAFVAGTAQLAATSLRLPVRMQRLDVDYLYGFSWAEPDGEGGEFRWARRAATAVVPAATRSLELMLRVNHADLAIHPTHVLAWVDGRKVVDAALTAAADSVSVPVLLPEGEKRVLIETRADRAVMAPPPDGRELAVMVRWRFRPSSR